MAMFEATDIDIGRAYTVSIKLIPGEILGVTGASGTGKTRLLRALCDLDSSGGCCSLEQTDRDAMPAHQWRRLVGYLPADDCWWSERVADHFEEMPDEDTLSTLQLRPAILNQPVRVLSSGERQRCSILRLLQFKPRVLLLDEPTSHMDIDLISRAEELFKGVSSKQGAGIIWVSHDLRQLERTCDRIYRLEKEEMMEMVP